MTIAHVGSTGVNTATAARGTTSRIIPWANVAAGRMAIVAAQCRPNTSTMTITGGTGWMLLANISGGAAGTTADTGPTKLQVWAKILDGTETGNITVSTPSGTMTNAALSVYSKTAGAWARPYAMTANDSTQAANVSATTGVWPTRIGAGAMLVGVASSNTDSTVATSAFVMTQTGLTPGTRTARNRVGASDGLGGTIQTWDAPIATAGTGTTAMTLGFTWTASSSGPLAVVLLQEGTPTSSLTDDFSTLNTTLWDAAHEAGGFRVVGGRAQLDVPGGTVYNGFNQVGKYVFDDYWIQNVTSPSNTGTGTYSETGVKSEQAPVGTDASFYFSINEGNVYPSLRTDYYDPTATPVAINATAMMYRRITYDYVANNFLFRTSPDGVTWTTVRTVAAPAWAAGVNDVGIHFEAHRDTGTSDVAEYDNLNLVASATTPVSGGVDLRWGVLSTATGSADLRWATLAPLTPVSGSLDLRWGFTTPVAGNADLRWNTLQRVTANTDLRWASLVAATGTLDLRWAVRTSVAAGVDLRWAVMARPSSSVDLRWSVNSAITASTDLRWTVLQRAQGSVDLWWATRAAATGSADIRWGVRNPVSGTLDLRWGVANPASGALDLRWAVRGAVSGSTDLRWAVRTPVTGSTDLRWSVLLGASGSTDLRWTNLALATGSTDLRWTVLGTNVQASGSVDLRWLVAGRVTGSTDLRWAVANQATGGVDLRWTTLTRVLGATDLRWAVRTAVSGALDVRWALRALASGSLDLRWAQLAVATGYVDLWWGTAGRVSGSTALQWGVRNAVAGTLDLRWGVRSQIAGSTDLRWVVRSRVVGGTQLLWYVEQSPFSPVPAPSDVRVRLTDRFAVIPEPVNIQYGPPARVSVDLSEAW